MFKFAVTAAILAGLYLSLNGPGHGQAALVLTISAGFLSFIVYGLLWDA
jgi:hypothetical protein